MDVSKILLKIIFRQAVVVQAFNHSTQEAEASNRCEFEASLVYRVNYKTARAITQRNPISKNNNKKVQQPSLLYNNVDTQIRIAS